VPTGATTLHQSITGGHPHIHPGCLDGNQTHFQTAQGLEPSQQARQQEAILSLEAN